MWEKTALEDANKKVMLRTNEFQKSNDWFEEECKELAEKKLKIRQLSL